MIDRAISPHALSKQLGVKPTKVLNWIRTGELRAINLAETAGKRPRWKILPHDLEEFFDSRRVTPPAPRPRRRRRRVTTTSNDRY